MMKIALRYGLLVTIVIATWVLFKHFVLHFEGQPAEIADVVVFNLAAIVGLVAGIKAKRAANGGTLTFVDGLKTGILIAVIYAILTSLFFAMLLAKLGPALLKQEGETSVLNAFLGISIGFAVMGTLFTAIISLILRRR